MTDSRPKDRSTFRVFAPRDANGPLERQRAALGVPKR